MRPRASSSASFLSLREKEDLHGEEEVDVELGILHERGRQLWDVTGEGPANLTIISKR